VHTITGHDDRINACAFSPDGRRLLSGASDGVIKVWDTKTWSEAGSLNGHWNAVSALAYSEDGRRVCSSSHDGTPQCCYTPDSRWLVAVSVDRTLRIFDTSTWRQAAVFFANRRNPIIGVGMGRALDHVRG